MKKNKLSNTSEAFRRKVAKAASEEGITPEAAGEQFNVSPKLVQRWVFEYAESGFFKYIGSMLFRHPFRVGGGAPDMGSSNPVPDWEAIKTSGRLLEVADESMKANREVVLDAVRQYGKALEFAHDSLKADREVVFEAVKQDGEALQFAAEELRNDEGLLRMVKS